MKICETHWAELRAAVDAAGMGHMIAKSSQEAFDNIHMELAGGEPPFDPLMACNWTITNNALASGGLYLMVNKEDGTEYCPVCEAQAHGATGWIALAVEGCVEYCREKGLLPKVQ
jgi:hypothetical protein